MTRKLFCSMFVMTLAIGFVAADEFTATITKVDGDTVTYQKYLAKKKGDTEKKKDGDAVTISAKGAKVAKGTFNKDDKKFVAGDAIADGLKNEMFTKITEKGVGARITTEGEGTSAKITQILIVGKKGKKGAN
jgi:hypothetical protein